MKRSILLLSAAAAAVLGACSTDPVEDPTYVIPDQLGTHTLVAYTPANNETRTHLGDREGNFTPVYWTAEDLLAVMTDQGTACKYKLTEGANTRQGTFTVVGTPTAEGAANLTAYYPHAAYDANAQTLSIPQQQNYQAKSFAPGAFPMYAETTGSDLSMLKFTHVAGVINIRLTCGADEPGRAVKSIELVSTDKTLAGPGQLTEDAAGNKVLSYETATADPAPEGGNIEQLANAEADGGIKSIVLTCAEAVQLDATTSTDFMFVVPAQTYPAGTLSFRITDADGNVVTKALTKELTVARAQIMNFTAIAVPKVVTVESADQIGDALTQAAGQQNQEMPAVVKVQKPVTESTEVTIPKVFAAQAAALTVEIPAVENNATLTFKEGTEGTGEGNLPKNITIVTDSENTKNLTLEMPNTTVAIDGKYNEVMARTAAQTLIVNEGTEISKLTAQQGSVKVYGTVGQIERASGYNDKILGCIGTQAGLERILAKQDLFDEVVIEKAVTGLDGKGGTFSKPLAIAANAELGNVNFTADAYNAIVLGADGIEVTLTGITVQQNSNAAEKNAAVVVAGHNDLKITIKDSHLIVPKSSQRGIRIDGATGANSVCTITLDNTRISPRAELLGEGAYDDAKNEIFKGMYDSRGISIGKHSGMVEINILNGSVIEGVFYAINSIQHSDKYRINVENARLDGRCAFNIWSNGEATITVKDSKLIGRNPFGGPSEIFGTVVSNGIDGAWTGSANHTITITDSQIYCYNNPATETNYQYAVELRSPLHNTLELKGTTTIHDCSASKRLPYAVRELYKGASTVAVDASVQFEGGENATILMPGPNGNGSQAHPYQLSTPDDLVWMAARVNAGEQKAKMFQGAYFVLANDIDMTGVDYEPMGSDTDVDNTNSTAPGFAGIFDGQNHTVKNITVSKGLRATGLFGTVRGGTIKNVTVSNITVTYRHKWMGGLVGDMCGGVIENCHVTNATLGTTTPANYIPAYRVGGLIGLARENLTITGCSVKEATLSTGFGMGGLIGGPQNSSLTITDCEVDGIHIHHLGDMINRVSGYFDSTPLLGDCSPVKALTLQKIAIGTWDITDETGSSHKWENQTWTMFPYIGEKPSACVPTLDGKALEVTPLDTYMMSSTEHRAKRTWGGEVSAAAPHTTTVNLDGKDYTVYNISNGEQFAWIAAQANAGQLAAGYGITFTRDIDLGNQPWTPVGYTGLTNPNDGEANYIAKGHLFSGPVLGNGHTIRNVAIDQATPARGIFGQVYGQDGAPVVIENLHAENVRIGGEGKWTGGLVGYVRNVSAVRNCSVRNVSIATGDRACTYGSGGLIGFISNNKQITVDSCSSENVEFTGESGWNNGGLIGKFYGNGQVTISDCEPVKGYFKTEFAPGKSFQTLTTSGDQTTVTLSFGKNGYQNSWFVGNITNQNGFDLIITNVADNSGNWTETYTNTQPEQNTLQEAAYAWPYIGVYDNYNKPELTGTITIDGKQVHPAAQ